MEAPKVVVFGGSGFVGKNLCKRLTWQQFRSVVPTRDKDNFDLIESNLLSRAILISDLSQSQVDQVIQELQPEDVVINLVGRLHSSQGVPYGKEFQEAHVDFPMRIIQSMKKFGIKRYIHMSALGADSSGSSMYLRSKGDAEQLVRHSGLDWTIFRPSVIFGNNDNFINMFGKLQKYMPVMLLAGSENLFQPVAVKDVSEVFIKAIQMPETIGKSYDITGPEVLTLSQIIQFAAKKQGVKRPIIPLPNWVGYVQAFIFEQLPGEPIMSRDNVASMQTPNILPLGHMNPLQEIFGITPSPLESLLK